jgi:hypothetical protein
LKGGRSTFEQKGQAFDLDTSPTGWDQAEPVRGGHDPLRIGKEWDKLKPGEARQYFNLWGPHQMNHARRSARARASGCVGDASDGEAEADIAELKRIARSRMTSF